MSRKTFVEFDRPCDQCGNHFTVTARKPTQRFCCRKCFSDSQKRQVAVTCATCGNHFSVPLSRVISSTMGFYCGAQCYASARKGIEPANKNKVQRNCASCGNRFECNLRSRQKYCCRKCFENAHSAFMKLHPIKNGKKTECHCEWCKKSFSIATVKLNRKDGVNAGRFCSRQCMNEWKKSRTGDSHPLKKKYTAIECAMCSKVFYVKPSVAHKSKFCSKECQSKSNSANRAGKNHPRYVEKVVLTCQWCGSQYTKIPSMAQRSKFCCRSCQGSFTVANTQSPTSIEVETSRILHSMGIEFIAQAQIDMYVCDFFLPKYNTVIEADGTYWHSLPQNIKRDKRKNTFLANKGYTVLRLPESKITTDAEWCKSRISECINQQLLQVSPSICTEYVPVGSPRPNPHQYQLVFDF